MARRRSVGVFDKVGAPGHQAIGPCGLQVGRHDLKPTPQGKPMPIDMHLFQLYLAAATVLVLIPGPDTLLVLGRSLFEGRRAGWTAATGTMTGNIVHAGL